MRFPILEHAQRAAIEFIFAVRDGIQEGLDLDGSVQTGQYYPFGRSQLNLIRVHQCFI
jgi:hypothetical protein